MKIVGTVQAFTNLYNELSTMYDNLKYISEIKMLTDDSSETEEENELIELKNVTIKFLNMITDEYDRAYNELEEMKK